MYGLYGLEGSFWWTDFGGEIGRSYELVETVYVQIPRCEIVRRNCFNWMKLTLDVFIIEFYEESRESRTARPN